VDPKQRILNYTWPYCRELLWQEAAHTKEQPQTSKSSHPINPFVFLLSIPFIRLSQMNQIIVMTRIIMATSPFSLLLSALPAELESLYGATFDLEVNFLKCPTMSSGVDVKI
jgi:hypothetical protein